MFSDKVKALCRKNPFVPLGCIATVGFLGTGLYYLKVRDSHMQNLMMRGRIAAQIFTVASLAAGAYFENRSKEKKDKPL